MSELLVIGNGFDLTIDANSSYSHFFNSAQFKGEREKVEYFVENYDNNCFANPQDRLDFSCWELLFYLETYYGDALEINSNKEIRWCDVEQVIHDSLTGTTVVGAKVA